MIARIHIIVIEIPYGIRYYLYSSSSKNREPWGGKVNFGTNGMLPAGFHDCTADEFITTFVDGFPTSQRRSLIVDALWNFAAEVLTVGIPYEFWVDGSFVTTKVNPNDADLVLFLQIPHMNILGPRVTAFRQKYAGLLDIYFAYAASPDNGKQTNPHDYSKIVNDRNYWRGQFGFDRTDTPKGIVRISCESITEYLKGR